MSIHPADLSVSPEKAHKKRSWRLWAGLVIIGMGVASCMVDNIMKYEDEMNWGVGFKGPIASIVFLMNSWKEEHKTYLISDLTQFPFRPAKDVKFSFWYSVKGVPTIIPGNSVAKAPCDLSVPPASVKVIATENGFTAAVKGNVDGRCDEWSFNEAGDMIHTLDAKPLVSWWVSHFGHHH